MAITSKEQHKNQNTAAPPSFKKEGIRGGDFS
jgi:hypothetical protein